MANINIDVSSDKIQILEIGNQGENEVTNVYFDISAWQELFGSGEVTLYIKRKGDVEPYYIELPLEENIAKWVVSNVDTANKGNGSIQLNYLVNSALKRTIIYPMKVNKSLVGSGEIPDPYDDWLEEIRKGVHTVEEFASALTDEVNDWLDNHPEATTTVQDGAISETKIQGDFLQTIKNNYVTPQMYGAVGDGVTDDLPAFHNAIASGNKVYIPEGTYYLSNYEFVDDGQIVDNKGTYTNKHVVTSRQITAASMSIADRKSIKLSTLDVRWGSGVAYNTDTGKLICIGYEDDKIAQIDIDTLTVENTVTLSGLGHGNDATYNTNTKKYYCVPMNNDGEVVVINDNLTISETITIDGMSFAPSQISYDEQNNIYYIGNSQYTYITDANFNIVKLLFEHESSEVFKHSYENIDTLTSQGSTIYNGQFLFGAWLAATQTGLKRGRSYARLVNFDYKDGSIKGIYDFPLPINIEEFESIEVINGTLCLFSCRYGTLFITKVHQDEIHLAHGLEKFPYYSDASVYANTYCTEADLKRIRTFVTGMNTGMIRFNLLVSTALPANTRDVKIGNLGVRLYDETFVCIPSQTNLGALMVDIKTNGDIYIDNYGSTAISGFYRSEIPIVLA